MATDRDVRPSEFGGRPGLTQRAEDGHVLTASESQALLRSIDPSDPDTPIPAESQLISNTPGAQAGTVRNSRPQQVGPFKHGYGNP